MTEPVIGRQYFIDPPSGWRYGFPRRYSDTDGPLEDFLRHHGYPEDEIDFGLKYLRMWEDRT